MTTASRARPALAGAGARGLLVATPALAIALACCQGVLGISGPVSLSMDACGIQAASGDCRSCVATHCCDQATACANDPNCAPLESCLLSCGSDYACRAECVAHNPFDIQPNSPILDTCLAANCNDACGMKCGMSTAFAPAEAAQACEDCLNRSCGATTACTKDLGCQLVGHCIASCPTPDCRTECLQGDAGALFVTQAATAGLLCLQPCDIGDLWSCIGKVSWPLAQQGPSDVTLTLTDQSTGAGIAAIFVKACPPGTDRSCTTPDSMGTTDSRGNVTLSLPTVTGTAYGFWGYFDLAMPVPPPQMLHYLYFLSYPLSIEHAKLSVGIYSPGDLASLLAIPTFTPDPARGNLEVIATDCLTIPAQNVTFTAHGIDTKTQVIYRQGPYLNAAATATDRSGTVFFLNAPPVPIKVEATPVPVGTVSSTVNVFVRPGALTIVHAIPAQE
jgi:hypothetical protein